MERAASIAIRGASRPLKKRRALLLNRAAEMKNGSSWQRTVTRKTLCDDDQAREGHQKVSFVLQAPFPIFLLHASNLFTSWTNWTSIMQSDERGIGGRFCAVFIIRHNRDDFDQRYPCIIESEIVLFRVPFWLTKHEQLGSSLSCRSHM